METVTDFIFLCSKITVDDNCSHEIKRHLFLRRKAMTKQDRILSKYINSLTKVHLVKAMVFSVVMYGCESWTIKKAECWRIDAVFYKLFYLFICPHHTLVVACGNQFPDQGLNPGPLDWEHGCLATRLSGKSELMLLNCGIGEDSWESLGLQGGQTSQS